MFSLLSRMKQIIILFFDAHLSNCQAVKNKRKVAMTIGMFSSTMPMFLTFLVNKLYKKLRKLFKFDGDQSLINLRILNLFFKIRVDFKSEAVFLYFIFERHAVPSTQLGALLHI